MRKVVNWTVLLFAIFSLTACATMSGDDMASKEPVKVKCPFCEHEFEWSGG